MLARAVAGGHQQVERQVGNERERVGRVHTLGGEQRVDVVAEIGGHALPLFLAELGVFEDVDILAGELAEQFLLHVVLPADEVADHRVALVDLLLRRTAVDGQQLEVGAHLLLEAANALHEELVQVGADYRQEEKPLEQRVAHVAGLAEHPPVELQPGEFAVQVPLGCGQVEHPLRLARLVVLVAAVAVAVLATFLVRVGLEFHRCHGRTSWLG